MNTVKTRKVGNSLAVTIPKELGISEGKEFLVYKGVDELILTLLLARKFRIAVLL